MSAKMSDHQSLVQSILQGKLSPVQQKSPFEYIETHISSVIVGEDIVYKLKKPLDLGFLDFSTLEKRHFYCDEELRLNRRLSPQLYLDVLPVYGSVDAPTLNASGDPIEYLLRMQPFAQSAQLDRLLQQGQLTREMIISFADYIARFHQSASVLEKQLEFGNPEVVWMPVAENFRQIRTLVKSSSILDQLNQLQDWTEAAYQRLQAVLLQRKRDGFIRECHGDLHLRNLAWVDNQPLAFDCIEFDPALYWIDVISDLSFLWMDLHFNHCEDLAWALLNQYLARTGDYASMSLLSFYAVYRAMVRAKIAAISFSQTAQQSALQEVSEHLDLAHLFTRSHKPVIYLMHGPSASGKSTLSQQLSAPLQAVILRSDIERKRLFGLSAEQSAAEPPGQGIYSVEATRQTYQHLLQLTMDVTEAGYSVIVDATFTEQQQRNLFTQFAAAQGYLCRVLDLKVSESVLRQRIQQRKNDVSDADLDVLEKQLQNWPALSAQETDITIPVQMDEGVSRDEVLQLLRVSGLTV